MDNIKEFLELFDIPEEEALQSLLSAFSPPQMGPYRQNWRRLSTFGNSSPTSQEIWKKFEEANYKCNECGSHLRITLDHKDGNSTNHSLDNLEVLCYQCNRAKSSKGTKTRNKKAKVYLAIMQHWNEHHTFPTIKEVQNIMGTDKAGIDIYMGKWLKSKLEEKKDD